MCECDCGSESECECDDKEMNGEGLVSGRGFHVATMTNKFHRIPQSETQIKSYFQGSGMCYECKGMKGTGSGNTKQVEPDDSPELPPYQTEQEAAAEMEATRIRILADREARRVEEAEAKVTRREAKKTRQVEEETRQREQYINNFKETLLFNASLRTFIK